MTTLCHSVNITENNVKINEVEDKEINIAILAEGLFLANLLLIPIVPFLVLFYLFKKYADRPASIAYNHLRQTFIASIFAGIFIVGMITVFYFFSSTSAAVTWTIIITYLTCIHSVFVMLGIYGLSKAMGGQKVKFPLIS